MSNYYGSGRSNYFRVKDMKTFKAWIESTRVLDIVPNAHMPAKAIPRFLEHATSDSPICLLSEAEDGDLPNWIYDEETDDETEIDFLEDLAEHLVDDPDNIFVWQSAGHEKMRYVSGYAIALNPKGDSLHLNINDIYDLACDEFGVAKISECTD